MGANSVSYTTKLVTQDEVRRDFDQRVKSDQYENGHSYSGGIGMARGIEFKTSTMFHDRMAAQDWVEDKAQKWGPAIAVPFRSATGEPMWLVGALCSS